MVQLLLVKITEDNFEKVSPYMTKGFIYEKRIGETKNIKAEAVFWPNLNIAISPDDNFKWNFHCWRHSFSCWFYLIIEQMKNELEDHELIDVKEAKYSLTCSSIISWTGFLPTENHICMLQSIHAIHISHYIPRFIQCNNSKALNTILPS